MNVGKAGALTLASASKSQVRIEFLSNWQNLNMHLRHSKLIFFNWTRFQYYLQINITTEISKGLNSQIFPSKAMKLDCTYHVHCNCPLIRPCNLGIFV